LYSVEILKSDDGLVVASCKELGLTCVGATEEEAVDELQTLVFFHTVTGLAPSDAGSGEHAAGTKPFGGERVLFVPPNGPVH
jgi:hypothetical protein